MYLIFQKAKNQLIKYKKAKQILRPIIQKSHQLFSITLSYAGFSLLYKKMSEKNIRYFSFIYLTICVIYYIIIF